MPATLGTAQHDAITTEHSSTSSELEAKPVGTAEACPLLPEFAEEPSRLKRFVARFGAFAFLFFLIKGLLWLIVPTLIALWSFGGGGEKGEASSAEPTGSAVTAPAE